MKILFTSIGRRVELIQSFRIAAQKRGGSLIIYGTDIVDSAPALFYCDKTNIVPRISDPEYIPTLLTICQQERIDALVPTIDTDLLLLAQNKARFLQVGTRVIVSDPDQVAICRDKRLTGDFFTSAGLKAPKAFDDIAVYDQGFPAFIKPKDGSSSINAFKVNNSKELRDFATRVPEYIVQPFVQGTEYTVDVFCDFEGNPIYITPRIRLSVRSGEVLKTEIRQDASILAEIQKMIACYKPCGAITVQLIQDSATGENWYIEINPRFGGGAPLSMKAGADAATALLELMDGQKLSYVPNAAEDGAVFSRFDQSVRVK